MVIRAVSRKVHTAHDITIMVNKAAIRAVVDTKIVRVDTITVKADMDSKADTVSTMPITIQMQDIRSRNA